MTRFSDEWLDAKLANIQRWKREEAARSAAKQSTGAGAPHAHGEGAREWPVTSRHEAAVAHAPATPTNTQSTSGSTEGRAPEIAPFGTTGVEGEIRELTRQPGGTPGGTRRATKWADLATALPVPQLESSPARSPSTAGAASPAGVPSTPVAAPAPSERDGPFAGACQQTPGARSRSSPAPILNATKADAQLTDAPGATRSHDGAARLPRRDQRAGRPCAGRNGCAGAD